MRLAWVIGIGVLTVAAVAACSPRCDDCPESLEGGRGGAVRGGTGGGKVSYGGTDPCGRCTCPCDRGEGGDGGGTPASSAGVGGEAGVSNGGGDGGASRNGGATNGGATSAGAAGDGGAGGIGRAGSDSNGGTGGVGGV